MKIDPRPGSICPETLLNIKTDPVLEITDGDGNTLLRQQPDGSISFGSIEPIGLGPIFEPPEIIHFYPPYSELVSRIVALERAVAILTGEANENRP